VPWSEKAKQECILQCSINNNCGALTCCGPINNKSKPNNVRCRNTSSHKHDVQKVEDTVLNTVNIVSDHSLSPRYDFTQIISATETTL
ncbi:hypothetical protein CDAR_265641, partial [Caerostris darwini]